VAHVEIRRARTSLAPSSSSACPVVLGAAPTPAAKLLKSITLYAVIFAIAPILASAAGANLPTDFFWDRDKEIAIARSAAPSSLSARAAVWVLTPEGYEKAVEGENDVNCLVTRGWNTPFDTDLFGWTALVAPVCYDEIASSAPLQEQLLRAELGLKGMTRHDIKREVFAAYGDGRIRALSGVGLSYMYSQAQVLGPLVGHWHPHLMIHASYYEEALLGPNTITSGDPVIVEGAETPRAAFDVSVNGRPENIAPET